jgi:hypothetical protein
LLLNKYLIAQVVLFLSHHKTTFKQKNSGRNMHATKQWIVSLLILKLTTAACVLLLGFSPPISYSQEWIYTVRPGDNLWDLSEKYLVDRRHYRRLQTLNNIQFPKRLTPGQRLRFPVNWLKIKPTSVQVTSFQGGAKATIATTGKTIPIDEGMRLRAGDAILTGPKSSVTLKFADGSKFLILPNSYLVLDSISAYGDTGMVDTRLRLPRGRLSGQIAPRKGPGTRFEIQTPAAISAVRGTDYRVNMVTKTSQSLTEVLTGKVAVQGANRLRMVPKGFGTFTEIGKPPAPPIRLLPTPDLSKISPLFDRVPFTLTLPTLEKAVAYRLQIAPTRQFQTLLFDRIFDTPQMSVSYPRQDGEYVLRVRGIDAQGLEGKDAYLAFELDAFPEPPVLLKPEPDKVVRIQQPSFEWSHPIVAKQYHLQVAENNTFDAPFIDLPNYSEVGFTPETALAAGDYYWRIATIDKTDEKGPFSDPQAFTIKPPPSSPALEEPEIDEKTLVLRWRQGASDQTYELQLAQDIRFEDVILDQRLAKHQIVIPRPSSGLYYLRIRTIDSDGYAGPYGSVQRISVPPESYWPPAVIFTLLGLMLLL